MIDWPQPLVVALARRRAVLFLGAGVSMNSQNDQGQRPPSWEQFLKDGIAECAPPYREMTKYLKGGDFLTCCQLIKYRLGPNWIPFVESKFLDPMFKPHEIHELLFGLDASIVVTPNFDTIYDNFALAKTENLLKIKKYYDDDIVRAIRGNERQRLILKAHGSIDTPDKLIFSREDYASVRQHYGTFYRAVEALIITHTFIFIGCGMSDPDLCLLLEQYAHSFSASPPHYLLVSGKSSTEYERMLNANFNVFPIRYKAPSGDHSELLTGLAELRQLVDAQRASLAERYLW